MADPKKQRQPTDPYASLPNTLAQQDDPYASMPDSFAATPDNKEGVYRMHTPDGTETKVPYSKVMDAYKAGYKIHPDDRITYANDKVEELKTGSYKGNRVPEAAFASDESAKSRLNPDTDIPEAYQIYQADPKIGSLDWFRAKTYGASRAVLNALPTAGGVVGGYLAAGAGAESGPGDLLIAPAGAAAGGGVGESIRQAGMREMFPYEHRDTPKESAIKIAAQAGSQALSEFTGRLAGRAVTPAIRSLSKTASESEKAGFRMLPSEAHGTPPNVFESYPKGSIFTQGKMAEWRVAQNQETEKAARDLADDISKKALGKTTSREEAGNIIRKGIESHMAKFRAMQTAMYNKVNKLAATLNPSRTDMVAFAKKELDRLNAAQRAGGQSQLSPFRERLQSIVNNKLPRAPFSAMKDLRSAILAEARNDNELLSGPEKGFLKKMAGIIDQSIMDEMKKSGIKGLPDLWRSANSFTREEHEIFEKKLIENLAANKNPEDIALVLRGNSPNAISQIGIQETRDAMSVIPKQLIPRVQKQILLDTIYEATGKGSKSFDEQVFAKKMLQIGDERGEVLFGNNWPKIKEFAGLLNKVTDKTGLNAASLSNPEIMKQVGRIALEAVVSASGVTSTGASHSVSVLAGLAPIAGEAALWKTVAAALTNPASAAKFLKGVRLVLRGIPYAATGAANELGGKKSLNKMKELRDEVEKRKPPAQTTTPTEKDDDTQPDAAPGSSLSVKPYTHVFDATSGRILPA